MKVARSKIAPRKTDKSFITEGILGYDVDNLYPQRMTNIVNTSGIATKCVGLLAKFYEGDGFKDTTFYKAIINTDRFNNTNDKLLRALAKDFAMRNGFAIHMNWNANYKITELRAIPFHDCRRPDEKNVECKNKIAVYDGWGDKSKPFSKDKICWIDEFNPDPAAIQKQVTSLINPKKGIHTLEDAWKAYKGQIFWYSTEGENYPLAPFDSEIEDIETDGRIKKHKRKKSASGNNLDLVIIHKGKFESKQEQQEFTDDVKDFMGEDGSPVCVIDVEQEEEAPTFNYIQKPDGKDFYSNNEASVQDNVRQLFGFAPILCGIATSGKLGDSKEVLDNVAFMNGLTNQERRIMEETFQMIFQHFHVPVNPSNDYSIIPLTLIKQQTTMSAAAGGAA